MSDVFNKNVIYNVIGNFVYIGSLWLISVMSVWFLGYEDAGELGLAMSIANIFITIASYNLRNYMVADIDYEHSDEHYYITRILLTVVSLVCCIGFSIIAGYSGKVFLIIICFYLYKCEEFISDILFGVMQRCNKVYVSGYSMVIKGIAGTLLFWIVCVTTNSLLAALIALDVLGLLLILLFDIPISIKIRDGRYNITANCTKEKCFDLLKKCLPLFLMALCIGIITSAPRIFFERIYTDTEMGYYSSIANIAVIFSTGIACVMMPLITTFSQLFVKGEKKALLKLVLKWLLIILVLGGVCVVLVKYFGNYVLSLVFDESILEYSFIFIPLVLLSIAMAVFSELSALMVAMKMNVKLILPSVFGALATIALSYIFVTKYYMNGVVSVQIISYGIMILMIIGTILWVNLEKKNENADNNSCL